MDAGPFPPDRLYLPRLPPGHAGTDRLDFLPVPGRTYAAEAGTVPQRAYQDGAAGAESHPGLPVHAVQPARGGFLQTGRLYLQPPVALRRPAHHRPASEGDPPHERMGLEQPLLRLPDPEGGVLSGDGRAGEEPGPYERPRGAGLLHRHLPGGNPEPGLPDPALPPGRLPLRPGTRTTHPAALYPRFRLCPAQA